MLDQLKDKLANNSSTNLILSQLSQPEWIYSLSTINMDELTKIVEGKQGNYKINGKISTAIYSILILRDHRQYNSKLAVETLSKYYRQLTPTQEEEQGNQHHQQYFDTRASPPNKTRAVLAALLLRVSNFNNYKMIIKDICPQLVSFPLFMQHRQAIMKQCPNLYQQFIVDRYKHIWPSIIIGDESRFQIGEDLKTIADSIQLIGAQQNILVMHREYQKCQKIISFTYSRIECTKSEQVNIQKIFTQLNTILKYEQPMSTQQVVQIPGQTDMIRKIKSSSLELLRLMVHKFSHFLFRKLGFILDFVTYLKNSPVNAVSIQPAYLVDFWTTLLQVFGIGCYDFDGLVGRDQADTATILKLLSALAYNDYSMNNKQETTLINHQSSRNPKKSQLLQIHLYSSTDIDSSFQPYLRTSTPSQRHKLVQKLLNFLCTYYSQKHRISAALFKSSQVLHILSNSKNEISAANLKTISEIKRNVLFKGYEKLGDGFENFCDDVFQRYIKKKSDRKLAVVSSTIEVVLEPKPDKNMKDSFMSFGESSKGAKNSHNELKRTNSLDFEFEGWGHKNGKTQKQDKSEMFYSIKECSEHEEKDKDRKQGSAAEEPQFLLTPDF